MSTSLLHLMHIVSPALPVGAYAYSQGLEFAIDSELIKGDVLLRDWIVSVMSQGVGQLDAPVLLRCYRSWQQEDTHSLLHWNERILALRETSELLLEDQQMGIALQRLLITLDVPGADMDFGVSPSFVSQFSLACVHWEISEEDAVYGLLWSWLENQIAAATKIVPLGQSHAQKILTNLLEAIPSISKEAFNIEDEDIGVSLPGVAMASAQHERQYSRLFRS